MMNTEIIMKYSLSFFVTAACFLVFFKTYWIWAASQAHRREGKSTPKSAPTMFDVRHLLQEGKKDAAIRVYAQIFKVSVKKARKDVEELDRSLEV